ncbi:hypothetical protein V6N13_139514 [Hibiscus sabdariffa]
MTRFGSYGHPQEMESPTPRARIRINIEALPHLDPQFPHMNKYNTNNLSVQWYIPSQSTGDGDIRHRCLQGNMYREEKDTKN